MKVSRAAIMQAALALLGEVGLEQLTLRLLGQRLGIGATTLYWHFSSKQALLDELASDLLARGAVHCLPEASDADWRVWASSFGEGLRVVLLGCRDGGRMVAATRLTDTEYLKAAERVASVLVQSGFTLRQAAVLLGTVYSYTLSLTQEEQAAYPRPGERSALYDLETRNAGLDPGTLPLMIEAGPVLLDAFDRRYQEGLSLILDGAAGQLTGNTPAPDS